MEAENLTLNPIDVVEEVVYQKKWSFSRAADHELVAELASKWCKYRLYFSWSENISAMSFTVTFDLRFPESHYERAYELLGLINERLWIESGSSTPNLRNVLNALQSLSGATMRVSLGEILGGKKIRLQIVEENADRLDPP